MFGGGGKAAVSAASPTRRAVGGGAVSLRGSQRPPGPQQVGASQLPWYQHHMGPAGCSCCHFSSSRRAPEGAGPWFLPLLRACPQVLQCLPAAGDSHLAPVPPGSPLWGGRHPGCAPGSALLFSFDALCRLGPLSPPLWAFVPQCPVRLSISLYKTVSSAQSRGRVRRERWR